MVKAVASISGIIAGVGTEHGRASQDKNGMINREEGATSIAAAGGPARGLATRAIDAFRVAPWITSDRLVLWGVVLGAFFAIVFVDFCVERSAHGLVSASGRTLGDDFVLFWSGAHLAAAGHAALAYDPPAFQAFGEAVMGPFGTYRIYVYPPIALLLSLPLASLSYLPGLLCWLLGGAGLFVALLRRLTGWRMAIVALFAAPASFMNIETGQNGFFTAALFAGGLMALERWPVLAGICLGCLAYKPQLALLLPIALAAGGCWRAFAAAAATVVVLVAASFMLFGPAAWAAFLAHAPLQVSLLEYFEPYWHRMPGVFTVLRLLGAPIGAATLLQLCSGLLAAAAVTVLWRSDADKEIKAAGLVIATFLAAPHLWEYDEVVVLFAAAWLARAGRRSEFFAWERLSILALILLPALRTHIGLIRGIPLTPLVLWPVLAALVTRRGMPRMAQRHGDDGAAVHAALPPALAGRLSR
jgi:hypothetical protein